MELPFAVESSDLQRSSQDDGSLMTASSQGSMSLSEASYDPILANTPSAAVGNNITVVESIVGNNVPEQQQRQQSAGSQAGGRTPSVLAPGTEVLSQFDAVSHGPPVATTRPETEIVDFTYVNVCETDEDEVDILLAGADTQNSSTGRDADPHGDILTVLLSGRIHQQNPGVDGSDAPSKDEEYATTTRIVALTEQANQFATNAATAKEAGDIQKALNSHTAAAKSFRDASVLVRDRNPAMATSLLLLCQTQARSALSLQRVVNLRPVAVAEIKESSEGPSSSQKERLRATLRGALENRPEEDISNSAFLGKATGGPVSRIAAGTTRDEASKTATAARGNKTNSSDSTRNPVDDMMELERELRNMDMALEMGNSIASLDARTQHRMKSSVLDGSFMVVPPGSSSFMASPTTTATSAAPPSPARNANPVNGPGRGASGAPTRPNRVHNMLEASSSARPVSQVRPAPAISHTKHNNPQSLESSWWGNSSTASHALASSVISLASGGGGEVHSSADQQANTKQLMRLMDSIKTLGDENAALLREIQELEAARMEAKTAKEQMRRFKDEYGKRFAALKEALEKFRKGYPSSGENGANPVASSEFARSATTSDQLLRQEQLIKKLTADLKKEKEDGKKKDAALRKYENFYREVKARSAQKAAQRQKEAQSRQNPARNLSRPSK